MFFHKNHFASVLDDDDADAVAKIANEVIDAQGKVAFGNLFEDGSIEKLSTEKQPYDTHVCLVIGLSEMGIFDSKKVIHIDHTESDEIAAATAALNRQLKLENKSLRNKHEAD